MKLMPNQIKFFAAVLAAGLVIILILLGLNYFRKTISHDLTSCSVTREGNPLVESLSANNESIQVNFKGKITGLEIDPVIKSHIIKLTSLDDSQTYKFNIRDQKGLYFDSKGEASGSALKTDQTLLISFTCDKKSNGFKFTKVLILS